MLGRQAFAKFMAASHYAYNILKIPWPRGIITVHGDPDMALECEDNGAKLADAVIAEETNKADELAKYADGVDADDTSILKKPTIASSAPATFEASKHTRNIDLTPGDSSRQVVMRPLAGERPTRNVPRPQPGH